MLSLDTPHCFVESLLCSSKGVARVGKGTSIQIPAVSTLPLAEVATGSNSVNFG